MDGCRELGGREGRREGGREGGRGRGGGGGRVMHFIHLSPSALRNIF